MRPPSRPSQRTLTTRRYSAGCTTLARTKSLETTEDEPSNLEARIASAISLAGPRNVAEISRLTRVHPETVRYKIKKRFERLGFRFHADVNLAKLGLQPNVATLNFSRAYYDKATKILGRLNDVGYLTFYGKIVPQGHFIAEFALPEGKAEQYERFLSRLKARGILDGFALNHITAGRSKTMDARFFNFSSGRWEVDWERVRSLAATPLTIEKASAASDLDYQDLLVVKELQKDARQHLTDIARKLKLHQKALEYHYRTHVQGRELVPSYKIRWTQDTAKRPAHASVITTRLTFQNLTPAEYHSIQSAISKIPFLWTESVLDNKAYVATLNVPVLDILEVSNYINDAISDSGGKMEMGYIRPSQAHSYTIPYNMFQKGEWRFAVSEMDSALRRS